MPHDAPNIEGLLITVRDYLRDLGPRLDSGDRYHALCCIYLLEIVERELTQWRREPTTDDERINRLAGTVPGTDSTVALSTLCEAIRDGRFDGQLDTLLPDLLAHVEDKVRISRPDILASAMGDGGN